VKTYLNALFLSLLIGTCIYAVQMCGAAPNPEAALTVTQLQQTYAAFNEEYFNNSLPKDAVVDYGERDNHFMATTQTLPDGRFHIAMNKDYVGGARHARLTLLHEQCHIKTWQREVVEHGRLWRSCMLQLDMAGAFREQLIDGYREH
jgi:hypothetical protein